MTQPKKSHHISWVFDGYEQHDRGTGWYLAAGTVVGILLVYSFVANNYLFAVLVFMVIAIVFLRQIYTPPKVECRIDTLGVVIDEKRYPFTQMSDFWILEGKNGVSKLYLHQTRGWHTLVAVPLVGVDVDVVREYLSEYLSENEEYTKEPLDEWASRVLKL